MRSENGVIQVAYKINDHKIIDMKITESPFFQCSVTQTVYDIDEAERCRLAELPMPPASSIMLCMTQPETFSLFNFLFEYMKDYQAAMSILKKEDDNA